MLDQEDPQSSEESVGTFEQIETAIDAAISDTTHEVSQNSHTKSVDTTRRNVALLPSAPMPKRKFKGSDMIFQRIKWDPSIDSDLVTIVYLDRFLGLQEIAFNEFKGVHEDYKKGIPLHRIRAFKIRDRIVWDREKRIDLLTGLEHVNYHE